jgi:hypothetical protein
VMVTMRINHLQVQLVSHILSCVQESSCNFQTLVFGSKTMGCECLGERSGFSVFSCIQGGNYDSGQE